MSCHESAWHWALKLHEAKGNVWHFLDRKRLCPAGPLRPKRSERPNFSMRFRNSSQALQSLMLNRTRLLQSAPESMLGLNSAGIQAILSFIQYMYMYMWMYIIIRTYNDMIWYVYIAYACMSHSIPCAGPWGPLKVRQTGMQRTSDRGDDHKLIIVHK